MSCPTIEASPRKKPLCPFCAAAMDYLGDGRYVCPKGCGEFLREEDGRDQAEAALNQHEAVLWPELMQGTGGRMREAMRAVATLPLGTADDPGPCRGHGGKGGSRSKGGKSQARQKLEAWQRKTSPGRGIRSIRFK